jgi:hypothetical protein
MKTGLEDFLVICSPHINVDERILYDSLPSLYILCILTLKYE